MIALDIRLGPDGAYQCRAAPGHSLLVMWLQGDLGRSGGGAMEELFEDLRQFREGRKDVVMTGGDAVSVVIRGRTAELQFFQLKEREDVDDLIDAVLHWFDVTNPDLAGELRRIGGLDPDHGRAGRQRAHPVVWQTTSDAEYPYQAEIEGARWQVRINDFPAELLYSLLIDGREVDRFNDWPGAWRKSPEGLAPMAMPRLELPLRYGLPMLLARILHAEEPRAPQIEQALETSLRRVEASDAIERFEGEMREPFGRVELRLDRKLGGGTLVIWIRPDAAVHERDVSLEMISRDLPTLEVNVDVPPEGVKTFTYRRPGVDVLAQFTLRSKHLQYVLVQWRSP